METPEQQRERIAATERRYRKSFGLPRAAPGELPV